MRRSEHERAAFTNTTDREAYLRANSHLPGARANLELLSAAAEEVELSWAERWAGASAGPDPTDVFVISVAVVALGRFVAGRNDSALDLLHQRAGDAEWRIREAVAIALQRVGDADLARLGHIALQWSTAAPLVQRAAVAAIAEPRLLRDGRLVPTALDVLDAATKSVEGATHQLGPDVRVLRQALGYAWSVVVAAASGRAWPRFDAWARSSNPDVSWIVRDNLKKNRLRRLGLTPFAS